MNPYRGDEFRRKLRPAWLAVGTTALTGLAAAANLAQAAGEAASGAAPAAALSPYVLPDKTASINLPADWRVVQTGVAFIRAQGPNGELAIFGIVVPARDAASTAITPSGLNQPYAADLKDKFTQSIAWVLEHLGRSAVPVNILSGKSFPAPPAFGSCANLTMLLGANGRIAAEADFCSLPVDKAGNYKNFFKIVGLGSARAKEERPTLEAILASYWLNVPAIRQQLANPGRAQSAPTQHSAMPTGAPQNQVAALVSVQQQQLAMRLAQAQVNAIQSSTDYMTRSSLQNASNFDHSILRGDTAVYGNGSSQPLFWVSD